MSKISEADIVEMRRLYGNERWSLRKIAKHFKCHHSTVAEVINRCDPTKQTAPFKKRVREPTKPDTTPPQHAPDKVVREPPRTEVLQASAKVEAEQIMAELVSLFNSQMAELQDLKAREAEYKKHAAKLDSIRDKLAIATYHVIYKQLELEGQAVINALAHEQRYKDTFQLYMMSSAALDSVKDTLSRMAALQKNMVMYFDNRQVNVTPTCARCSRPLRERIQDYEQLWVQDYEAKIIGKAKVIDVETGGGE